MLLLTTTDAVAIDRIAQHLLSQNHQHVTHSVSTNSELIEQILTATLSDTQPAILTADSQIGGRGQHGRSWQSPKGNLYFSFYHPLNTDKSADGINCLCLTAPITGLLSLCVAYQLANMPIIRQINLHRQQQNLPIVGVKWVNDIGFYQLVNKRSSTDHKNYQQDSFPKLLQFYKLAGILIEPVQQAGKLRGVVIGIGINVQTPPTLTPIQQEHMGHQAVGLTSLSDLFISPQDLYYPVLTACLTALLIHDRMMCEQKQETRYSDEFLHEFAQVDVLAGKLIDVRAEHQIKRDNHGKNSEIISDNIVLTGRAMGIDRHGCLQVKDDGGKIHTLFTGSVFRAFGCDDIT